MGVEIKLHKREDETDSREFECAKEMENTFKSYFSKFPKAMGSIHIYYSLTLNGQSVRDIDLLVSGTLDNFKIKSLIVDPTDSQRKDVIVHSFCYVIELKDHSEAYLDSTHIMVKYNNTKKDVTNQNENQKYAFVNYFNNVYNYRPFVTNVIWMHGLSQYDLKTLGNGNSLNAVPRIFSFPDLVKIWSDQIDKNKQQKDLHNTYHQNATSELNTYFLNDIDHLLSIKIKLQGLTKKKFELLTQKEISNFVSNNERLTIYKGRAGTGKTVCLLQSALKLVEEQNKRCIILTYNLALVSDLRRLVHFFNIPDNCDSSTLQIQGLHKFFMEQFRLCGIPFNKDSDFGEEYSRCLIELSNFVGNELTDADIDYLKNENETKLDWDYILIDEAQDWKKEEKEILFKLYGPNRILVADGIDQFMRSTDKIDFGKGLNNSEKKCIQLKKGLRQKPNLTTFNLKYAEINKLRWSIKINDDANVAGGKVYIMSNKSLTDTFISDRQKECLQNDGENYDMLFLVPPSFVANKKFKYIDRFKKIGIELFDGTSMDRDEYSIDAKECRVYQYDSCRGLEAWTTFCLNFDELIDYKRNTFKDNPNDHIDIDSDENRRKEYAYIWSLMPLSRPIDTLVITLKNPEGEFGKIFKKIAKNLSDGIVEWIN